ncbi:MAG: Crp/Fnr family transcriptional regulator [Halanaerobium sp.]|nr:Crp/Fnr family transcriptional regulator [Halanaerobium sp.]
MACQCERQDLCVARVPIFSELECDKLQEINQLVTKKEYRQGETIFLEGERSQNIYILHEGMVKNYKISPEGREYIIRLLREGDYFGELILFKDEPLTSYAEALTDVTLCLLNKQDLEALLQDNPALALKLLASFSSRLQRAEQTIETLALEDARQKVIRLLVNLAEDSGKRTGQGIRIDLPLNRNGLASFLGITQETLSRKLTELLEEGIITEIDRKKIVINNELLNIG